MKVLSDARAPDCPDEAGEQGRVCLYLQRPKLTPWYPIEGYCLAQREAGLRVVTIAEFQELCTKAEHVDCELFRRRREEA